MQDYSQKGGIIDIHGGTVTATGGAGGAGIGGGLHGSADNITIKGGTVRAVGGYGAAGIGGDQNGSGGRTVISGGSIVATAGTGGENIGKGMNGEDSGTLTDGNYFVYPAVLTLEGASDGTPLTHFDSNVNYGIEGVKSTGKNYYLYLPAHAEIYGANHANIREYKDGYYSDCGHFNSAYTYRDDQNHVFTCEDCGAEVTEGHSRNAAGDRTANCQEPAYCGVCQHNYGAKDPEVHLFDENGLCTCGATETITVVAGDRQIPAATARQLQAALEEVLLAGETAITVHLPADADAELFATIRGALIRTEDVEAGSIDLTLVGVTAIPAQPENGGDQPIFGLGEDGAVLELKSVSLPDVTEIGAHAFNGCKNLTSLSAPKVQTVGVFAFYATGLSALDLPQAETIGENAFAVCAGLTSVKLPKATSIGNYAFRFDSKLASVALTAEDAISVGTDAFNKISGDAELILHNSKTAEVTDGSFGGAVFKAVRFTCMDGSLDHGFACTAKDGGLAHTKVCGLCGYQYSEAHSLEEGVCIVCGAKCVLQTPPAAKELTYTGQPQALTAGGAAAEGVLLFALGENAEDIPSVWQETVPQATDAGTYYVWYRVDHTDNSADTAPQPIQVMIAPAVPGVAWENTTESVGFSGAPAVIIPPVITLQNNEPFTGNITYTYTGDSEGEGLPVNVGTYEITAKFDEQGNYTAATGTNRLSLTIQKAAATVEAIPKQQHFYDTATTNSLDLGAYLPQDRGETHYVLIAVSEDVFDLKSVDTLGDILSYTTLVTPGVASGRIELMAIMENYEDVLLEIPVQLVGVEGVRNARIATEALSSVPDGLAGTAFNTVEKIKSEQQRVLTAAMDGDEAEGFAHYDVRLQISPDGGKTWQDAPAEMIPASGLEVTLPYPAGTGKDTHDFFVSHMFTGGEKAGTTELPAVTKTETGIRFTVTGLSPVSVAWLPVVYEVKVADVSNGTVTTDVSQAAGGTQVTVTVTPKSGYELSKLAVKTADGTACPVTAGKSGKYSFTMPHGDVTVTATFTKESVPEPESPETGDHLQPVLWGSIAAVSMLSLVAIAVMFFRKKKLP